MTSPSGKFTCTVCGNSHVGAPTDSAFTLPDLVWELSLEERVERARWTTDLCRMDDLHFIRCLLEIPFTDQPGYYGWGVWVQIEGKDLRKYLEFYDKDGTAEPPISGTLANELPTYGSTLGMPLLVQFRTASERPAIEFADGNAHPLAREAKIGMSYGRFHEVLLARGLKSGL